MDFDQTVQILNSRLKEERAGTFSGGWVRQNAPKAYRYIVANIRTALGNIDWDRVVVRLDRELQRRWTPRRPKTVQPYRNSREVEAVLAEYREKLYVFVSPADANDRRLRDAISIALVRTAQKGNLSAREELLGLLRYVVDHWIEYCPRLERWRGYTDAIEQELEGCIRRYRYTGTFIGYLFRTLEYAGRGLRRMEICMAKEP